MSKSLAHAWTFMSTDENGSSSSQVDFSSTNYPTAEEMLCMNDGTKLIIILVGKAARGKTVLAGKVKRYLSWLGYKTMHFEASEYRKKMFGSSKRGRDTDAEANVSVVRDIVRWLQGGGQVAIFDTKNNTKEVRRRTLEMLESHYTQYQKNQQKYTVLWVESYCEDLERVEKLFLESNTSKYSDKKSESAILADFRAYLTKTDAEYETLDPLDPELKDVPFIKIYDFGETMVTHKVQGYIESKLASFCVNVHTETRYILLVRHGESVFNTQEKLGGNSELTEKGHRFAKELGGYISKLFPYTPHSNEHYKEEIPSLDLKEEFNGDDSARKKRRLANKSPSGGSGSGKKKYSNSKEPRLDAEPEQIGTSDDLVVYTSNLKRSVQSASYIKCAKLVSWLSLAEIDVGICEGMTNNEFKVQMFAEYSARQRDKLRWRYPQGESYVDLKKRLEPVIFEIERERRNMLIVGHRGVLRCLYSYFLDIEESEIPFLPFPLHTVVALKATLSGAHGWVVKEDRIVLDPGLQRD